MLRLSRILPQTRARSQQGRMAMVSLQVEHDRAVVVAVDAGAGGARALPTPVSKIMPVSHNKMRRPR
jgi:hypothetical protein